jgi:hypothetical protein
MLLIQSLCSHCNDVSDLIAPYNGKTLLASTTRGEIIVDLHTRCEENWANKHNCHRLVPLRKMRHRGATIISGSFAR